MFFNELKKLEKNFIRIKKELKESRYITENSETDVLKFLLIDISSQALEKLSLKARRITDYFFGRTILLYTPLYISDYCRNGCLYCGFSALNKIKRKKLSYREIEKEMSEIRNKGFNTILILTGEDRYHSSFEYILNTIKIARKYFSEILIEVYPLNEDEYRKLVENGLTGVTLYQETYDKNLYKKVHLFGPKKDFRWRLDAIERALKSKVKEINIGPLLGLNKNWQFDVYMTLMHARYIEKNYPDVEISISYPRIQRSFSKTKVYPVSDKDFVKTIIITRIFLPRVQINISTREPPYIRDNLIGFGVTKMSAESKTVVGGHYITSNKEKQFEINDNRTLEEIMSVIRTKNYRPEFNNWIKV